MMRNSELTFDKEEDGDINLWQSILHDVDSNTGKNLPSGKSILVFGDSECGKSSLITKIQGSEHQHKGSALEYLYLSVTDEIREDVTRLGVWLLDSNPSYQSLLKYALPAASIEDSCIIICVSMERPQLLIDTLEKLITILEDHIDSLKLSDVQHTRMTDKIIKDFQDYQTPGSHGNREDDATRVAALNNSADISLPLGEDTLTHNLGVPIIVVVTKCDCTEDLENENSQTMHGEHLDFIQKHLRLFCLRYGAALVYTSVKEERNCDLLRQYILHRCFALPFASQPDIVDRDSVFVPSGWDTKGKITILSENFSTIQPTDEYNNVIQLKTSKKMINTELETKIETTQEFLTRVQSVLQTQATASSPHSQRQQLSEQVHYSSPNKNVLTSSVSTRPGAGITPSNRMSANKQMDTNKMGESVLASFFNSLIKTNATPAEGEREALARDASAELDKIKKSAMNNKEASETPATTNETAQP